MIIQLYVMSMPTSKKKEEGKRLYCLLFTSYHRTHALTFIRKADAKVIIHSRTSKSFENFFLKFFTNSIYKIDN